MPLADCTSFDSIFQGKVRYWKYNPTVEINSLITVIIAAFNVLKYQKD